MRILGVNKLVLEMEAIQKRIDIATLAATKKAQKEIVKNVRKNMRGRPRWNHRGRSRIYPADINVAGMPRHVPRSGGPGQLTGMLYAGVGGVKVPVSKFGIVKGGVGVGGKKLRSNQLKKKMCEERYPFFEPGVHASEAAIGEMYAVAWKAAMK